MDRYKPAGVVALLALTLILCAVGCGGGASTGGNGGGGGVVGGGGGNPGTPVGSYSGITVTVTINGVAQSINNLSVNVQ